jgi:hypothetical protein
LEGGKNHNSAETLKRPKISSKFMFDQPVVHHRQTVCEADFRRLQKHTEERNLLNASQSGF